MRPRHGLWPPMNMLNGMRLPMRGRGIGPGGPMRGMGPRPPSFPGMGPPMRPYGHAPMGPRGPSNQGHGPIMHRMRPPPPHMMPSMMHHQRPMRPQNKNMNKMLHNEGKVKKKKKLKFRSFYVTRPWVNDELRAEISKKDKLFEVAKSSNKGYDWIAFKEQKDKCVHMYSTLKLEFIGQHPEEVCSSDEYDSVEEDVHYMCEACDRTFDDDESHQKHMQEHQTCGIDGCKFNAHELLVITHIKMQHTSGLYDKIRNISTPEDIEKWREQRRKNYPSKANIELRYKEQEEKLKRGERIGPNKDRFGKTNKLQGKKKKIVKKRKKKIKKTEEAGSLINEKADWNGTMFPFKGTRYLEDEEISDEDETEVFSDDEWGQDGNKKTEEIVLNNALGALMDAYQSDESDGENKVQRKPKRQINKKPDNFESTALELRPSTSGSNIKSNLADDILQSNNNIDSHAEDDFIIEEKILKAPVNIPDKATEMKMVERKRTVPVTATSDDMPIPQKKARRRQSLLAKKAHTPYQRKPTLLQKLLDKEIRHERNVILQCVRYVVNNNFFDAAQTDVDMNQSNNIEIGESISENVSCEDKMNEGPSTSKA